MSGFQLRSTNGESCLGQEVYDCQGVFVGTVDELLVDFEEGRINYLLLQTRQPGVLVVPWSLASPRNGNIQLEVRGSALSAG